MAPSIVFASDRPSVILMPMKLIKTLTALIPIAVLAACSNPADKVPAAAVSSSTNAPADTKPATNANAVNPPAAVEKFYAFGPDSGTIEFIGSKVTGSHNGGFKNFAGDFKVVDGKLVGAGSKIVIDTTSIWTDNDRLTGHLKTPDFFDVARFPTATFVTTSVGDAGAQSTVTGNLTLHGVTKQISFPARIQVSEVGVNVVAEFSIIRTDFDIKYEGKANDLIRKEVVLKLKIVAAPGRANFDAIEKAAPPAKAASNQTRRGQIGA
jgi:polyisoprenoid-binding protein YceI